MADPDRTEKTICLAITPSMKALGLSSRCRVFEIPENVDYVMAKPRMQRYMEASADIYSIYPVSYTHLDVYKRQVLVFAQIPGATGLYPIEMTSSFFQAVYPLSLIHIWAWSIATPPTTR